jgi:RNA polymerase primary sigma factor
MTAKELNKALETLFAEHKSETCMTFESISDLFDKQPTAAQAKNIHKLSQKHKVCLFTSSEHAKMLNEQEAEARRQAQLKMLSEAKDEDFDILKEHELLEWSRSDSPVRMYLREMGQIPLLTKEEEIEISKKIEYGESIIIDAICSVPYLIDFILDYKEPLINRERRVKELFKSLTKKAATTITAMMITATATRHFLPKIKNVSIKSQQASKHSKKRKKIGSRLLKSRLMR